jgi:hypothetical protein
MIAEGRLLCACVRRRAQNGADPVRIENCADVDWNALLALSERHGVAELLPTPLLAGSLSLPADVVAQLHQLRFAATARNLERATQLIDLMVRLERHGIRAATFKGPALAAMLYGDLGSRRSSDLDILVERRALAEVCQITLADGYQLPPRRRRRGSLFRGLYPAAGRDETVLPDHPAHVAVEVHVALAHWTLGLRLRTAELLERSVLVDIAGHPTRTLSAEDLLLALAVHGTTHDWGMLRFVCDIDAAAAAVTNWTVVIDRASAAHMRRLLTVAVLVAHEVLGTALPASVLAWAQQDAGAQTIAAAAARRLFADPWVPPVDLGSNDPRFLPYLDGPVDRWRFRGRGAAYEWLLKWPWDRWLGRRYHTREGSQ